MARFLQVCDPAVIPDSRFQRVIQVSRCSLISLPGCLKVVDTFRNQEHVICQGDKCLVIKENMSKNNYCMECAALILQKAREELACLITESEEDNDATTG